MALEVAEEVALEVADVVPVVVAVEVAVAVAVVVLVPVVCIPCPLEDVSSSVVVTVAVVSSGTLGVVTGLVVPPLELEIAAKEHPASKAEDAKANSSFLKLGFDMVCTCLSRALYHLNFNFK